jgi:hypothetical protein
MMYIFFKMTFSSQNVMELVQIICVIAGPSDDELGDRASRFVMGALHYGGCLRSSIVEAIDLLVPGWGISVSVTPT